MTTRNIWHASLMRRAGIRRVAAVLLLMLLTTATAWAQNSVDLADFLTAANIYAPQDENRAYMVMPDVSYKFTLTFAERYGNDGTLQFPNDDSDMTYSLPEELNVADGPEGTFTIAVKDGANTYNITDNTYRVDNNVLTVNFNSSHEYFGKLTAAPNAQFTLPFERTISNNADKLVFADGIEKAIVIDDSNSVTVLKSSKVNFNAGEITYTVTVQSYGKSENVYVKDIMTSNIDGLITELSDFSIKSSVSDHQVSAITPTMENGYFTYIIPLMSHGEVITISYKAVFDPTKLSSDGNGHYIGVVNNTAEVWSDGDPEHEQAPLTTTIDSTVGDAEVLKKELLTSDADLTKTNEDIWTEFRITLNSGKQQLNGGQPLTMTDTATNLNVDVTSINAEPSEGVTWEMTDNTVTYTIPDATSVVITYRARVTMTTVPEVGTSQHTTFSNRASMKDYSDEVVKTAVLWNGSQGSGSIASINLIVHVAGNINKMLSGAKFQLQDKDENPVLDKDDKPIEFVSDADGMITIKGNLGSLGWAIKEGEKYYLKELEAPTGYKLAESKYQFTVSADGTTDYSNYIYNSGDTMMAENDPIPATAPSITAVNGAELTYGYTSGSVSVTASAAEGHTITGYQWYSNTVESNENGTPINGATDASYTVPTGKGVGTTEYYYCVVTATRTDNSQTAKTTSNVATVSVGKATAKVSTAPTANSRTYDSNEEALVTSGSADTAIEYALGENAETAPTDGYSETIPVGTGAGDYYVWYRAKEDDNHEASTAQCVTVNIVKANYYQSDDNLDITKYVPSDKAGRFTITLPALPTGATYSCYIGQEDDVHMLISTYPTITSGELTFTTNSGKAAGTTGTITVEAKDAPNYNDYSFTVNAIVSEYTVAYEWPEQTNIWLDADNEQAWAESGITIDRSKLTVKKNGATVTNYTAKVGDTELTDGENTLALEPGAYRIAITSADGKLDDWVEFSVIQLTEDGQDLTLNVPNWYYPDVALKTEEALVPEWAAIVGSVTYAETTIELSKEDISKGNGIDNESLKLWFTNTDKPHMSTSVFMTREMTIDDFYYDGGTRSYITPFGSVVEVGGYNVYLPNHVTVKQLLDDDGNAIPAGDNGGKIYYMCNSRPDLHVEKSETEVGGQTETVLTLYNGDTPVSEGYYFRHGDDFYYGNGENAYKSYGGDYGFISFWPVKSYAQGSVYPMGDKPVTQRHAFDGNLDPIFDENGNPKYVSNTLGCGNYTKMTESHYESSWDVNTGTLYVGKNYIYYGGNGGFLYTGDVAPSVQNHELWIGNYHVPLGTGNEHVAVALMPNDEIDGSQASDVWILPHAYARYKADDYHYQIADCEFVIYPNNSLVTIKDKEDVYHAGDNAEIVVELQQLERGMNIFVNGSLYQRFEGYGDHPLTIPDLREGKYTIDVFGDGDDYVTDFQTSTSFTVVRTDPVLTITGTTPAGAAFVNGGEIEYDPEKPVIITVANDAAVSGTSWKWTISDTDVVTQDHIVNESGENAVNRESIYLNTVGLGEVTVTARFSGNELYNPARKSITFTVAPLMTTLFAANTTNQWMTWCNAYAWTLPEGCNAYTINSVSGTTVTLNEVTAEGNASVIIPAYTPVLIQRETIGDDAVMAEFSAVGTAPETGYNSETGLVTSTGTGFTFYGNSGNDAITTGYYTAGQTYGLYNNVFVRIDSDSDNGLAAHRCVLTVSGSNARQLSIGTEATGITTTDYTDFTDSDGAWYSLDGRKLNGKPTKKGLYIHNGVKTIIK